LVADHQGLITQVNPSILKLFGYTQEELIGQKVEMLIPRRFAHAHEHQRAQFHKQPRARSMGVGMNLFAKRKDNSEFPVEISLSPYHNENGQFVIAFIIDITVRKESEERMLNYSSELEQQVKNRTLILEEAIEELERTKGELKETLENEKELNQLKSRFVSMASHEFRTPLATIMSSLSLITRYSELNDTEKQQKHIGKIKSAIHNLTEILNDFLSVSKLEEGKVECNPEDFEIGPFVEDVLQDMALLARENQQHFFFEHEGAGMVSLDKKLLKNILFNLCSNALKFSREGGSIFVRTVVSPGEVKILVKDEGIGISEEDQRHLFERFFRGDNAMNIQGTGLGLNIVSKYAELMKGKVVLESVLHQGTEVTLIFPQG